MDDAAAVETFARQCDVITLEFENIPAETIALCGKFAPTYPSASVLATAQDRISGKDDAARLPVCRSPRCRPVHDRDSLAQAAQQLGWPLIVKTARSGYDGKGQVRVESMEDAKRIRWRDCDAWIAEQCIDFDLEVSVVVARAVDGRKEAFPVFENSHRNHILDVTVAPASIPAAVAERSGSSGLCGHRDVAGGRAALCGVLCPGWRSDDQ